MKKDIKFPKVEGVSMVIARQQNEAAREYEYFVYIINENDYAIHDVIVNSSGYSNTQKTSTLRHYIEEIEPQQAKQVELINADLFALVNQFWVSYYREKKVYDKKFVFMPESVTEDNFQYIKMLDKEGVRHA